MSSGPVWGAGRPRGGATDTTMLIWKVIAANPGITRAGIWEQVEHSIPDGYALRLYAANRSQHGKSIASASAIDLARARGYVLTLILINLRAGIRVSWIGERGERRYTAVAPPSYRGNPEAVDETGTKAAEHMAVADALRKVERMLATPTAVQKYGRRNCEALAVLVKALRAKGGAAG